MRAAVLTSPQDVFRHPLRTTEEKPTPQSSQVQLKGRACGVCRTDLHVVDGGLAPQREGITPGHQVVGDVVEAGTSESPAGTRVGVSWIGGIDGNCWYCQRGCENLCEALIFTGYSVNGGYAEYAVARRDFVFPLPSALGDLQTAPLLCAGIIGFRSLRVAEGKEGELHWQA